MLNRYHYGTKWLWMKKDCPLATAPSLSEGQRNEEWKMWENFQVYLCIDVFGGAKESYYRDIVFWIGKQKKIKIATH